MNEVKIEEIANELGIKSRELISRIGQLSKEALFSLNIKSGGSIINVEKIFASCLYLNRMFIIIPKEYWNKQVEILVLPLDEMVQKVKQKKKKLQELLSLESIDIEEVKVSG